MARETESPSHRRRDSEGERERERRRRQKTRKSSAKKHTSTSTSEGSSSAQPLSIDALAQLNRENVKQTTKASAEQKEAKRAARRERDSRARRQSTPAREARETNTYKNSTPKRERRDYRDYRDSPEPTPVREYRVSKSRPSRRDRYEEVDLWEHQSPKYYEKKKKKRVVSGAVMEEGREKRHLRGGAAGTSSYDSLEKEDIYEDPDARKKKKRIFIGVGFAIALAIIIAVAVVVSKNKANNSDSTSGLSGISPSSIPSGAPTWLDPFQWADTTDFNLTYTTAAVGDLPIMGLNTSWDDSAAANQYVPALNQDWGGYATRPARGVNIGGWLSIEPFITPSLFNYATSEGIIDEYTLCQNLGSSCASTLEKHYSTFVTESTFKEIADAGLDHVRIPYSYWAVQTYDNDPYVFRTSWRYLLRGIEWARKYGLRVNLDLHALPGSQNGWNHSGRQGPIGWFNGTDGNLNAQRSLDIHDRLSKFFAQDRYQNIISHYGLANEPRMTFLSETQVLNWTATAYAMVKKNGVQKAVVVFGDGFRGLDKWQGELTGYSDMALDVHQYVIFNTNQIVFNHTAKVSYACDGWTEQTLRSMNTATGYGPTLIAEWSQADTDCAKYLTNVGWGNRWTGTFLTGNASDDITTPRCPLTNSQCNCDQANADASQWTATYKQFLLMFAEAQMTSFEKGWGWFYWVWDTESAPQWSYKKGMAAGILPAKAYAKSFNCNTTIPSFSDLPEYY